MRKIPNAQRLQYFLQVSVTGSVRGASEILGVDPSSISRAISQLEKEMGLRLLERKGRGVTPTETGKTLARYARRQTDLLEEFYDELRESKNATRGHVEVGLGEGMLNMLFYPAITNYMRDNPHITLNLIVSSVKQHISDLVEDKLDIGLLYGPPSDVRLRQHINFPTTPIQTIVHKDHPLTRINRPLLLADLAAYNGATLHPSFGLHRYIRAAEISEQTQLKYSLFTSSYRALWQYANAGLGYTLCGTSFDAWFNMPELVALPMNNPIFNQSSLIIVTRAGRHLSPAARSLLQHIMRYILQHTNVADPTSTVDSFACV